MNKKILIVDDEALIRDFIGSFFSMTPEYSECRVDFATNGEEAIAKIDEKRYDLIFTDLKMPIKNGLEVTKHVKTHYPETDTVLITAFGGAESASKAMAYGAYEYITKPISIDELEMIIKHIFERQELVRKNKELQKKLKENIAYPKIIGRSKGLTDVMDIVKMVAPTNSTVLITGESGTGKELIAEAIHYLSPRKENNFVKINCAALPEQLIESELFGFEKGAFTGAIKKTRGKFEISNGGSILLDEISEMNLDLQAKLLRVIQEKEIIRIGSEVPMKINTRVIATSNRDLVKEVKEGKFREDLFFRLNIVPIHLPPLRERKEDIPYIINDFIKKISFDLGMPKKVISSDAMDLLLRYDWPGNIRELQNAIERSIITTRDTHLTRESFFFLNVPKDSKPLTNHIQIENDIVIDPGSFLNYEGRTLADIEKELIFQTLEKTNQNKTEAAKILGITSRTLRNKLKLYKQDDDLD